MVASTVIDSPRSRGTITRLAKGPVHPRSHIRDSSISNYAAKKYYLKIDERIPSNRSIYARVSVNFSLGC